MVSGSIGHYIAMRQVGQVGQIAVRPDQQHRRQALTSSELMVVTGKPKLATR